MVTFILSSKPIVNISRTLAPTAKQIGHFAEMLVLNILPSKVCYWLNTAPRNGNVLYLQLHLSSYSYSG